MKVSWIRQRDLHVLTIGNVVYTSDARIAIKNVTTPESITVEWNLHIFPTRVEDSGIYECQINTEPKKSKAFHLDVVGN